MRFNCEHLTASLRRCFHSWTQRNSFRSCNSCRISMQFPRIVMLSLLPFVFDTRDRLRRRPRSETHGHCPSQHSEMRYSISCKSGSDRYPSPCQSSKASSTCVISVERRKRRPRRCRYGRSSLMLLLRYHGDEACCWLNRRIATKKAKYSGGVGALMCAMQRTSAVFISKVKRCQRQQGRNDAKEDLGEGVVVHGTAGGRCARLLKRFGGVGKTSSNLMRSFQVKLEARQLGFI